MHHAFAHSVRPFTPADNDHGPSGGIREGKETDTSALAANIGHLAGGGMLLDSLPDDQREDCRNEQHPPATLKMRARRAGMLITV